MSSCCVLPRANSLTAEKSPSSNSVVELSNRASQTFETKTFPVPIERIWQPIREKQNRISRLKPQLHDFVLNRRIKKSRGNPLNLQRPATLLRQMKWSRHPRARDLHHSRLRIEQRVLYRR